MLLAACGQHAVSQGQLLDYVGVVLADEEFRIFSQSGADQLRAQIPAELTTQEASIVFFLAMDIARYNRRKSQLS
jgi:hypothetical protein